MARIAKLLRSPVVQFLATGLLTLRRAARGHRRPQHRAAHDEALLDAQAYTELLARSVAEPAIPRELVEGDPGRVDRFDRRGTDGLAPGRRRAADQDLATPTARSSTPTRSS